MAKPEGFEFRPAGDNEMAQVLRLGSYVFASPPSDDDPPPSLLPAWTQCAFKGESLAACSGGYPFLARMNGKTTAMQGVTLVGTEPEFRRRGLVRQLITDLLHRAKEEGQLSSILLASRGAIYQRFGYGLASMHTDYTVNPKDAALLAPFTDTGSMHRASAAEARPIITEIFKHWAKPRNVYTFRADTVWDMMMTDVEKDKAYCAIHSNADGVPDGFCIYTTKWTEGENEQEMQVRDFVYLDTDAYKAMWQFLTSHDLVGEIKFGNITEDDPAPGLLLEPRCLNRKTRDGLWLRVVDAEGLMAARGYDMDGEATVCVQGDDICPWNNGTWKLSVNAGEATVDSATGTPDITVNPNALAMMLSGFMGARQLQRLGLASGDDVQRLTQLDALFSTTYRGAMSFGF